jgi:2-polyprenyl-3-methyl-5-hydroxy-6-metoxy-1,4-benzoquinol methylase
MMTPKSCPICGANDWNERYRGPIRDGAYGKTLEGAVIYHCGNCHVERLDEQFCLRDDAYEDGAYRPHLGQTHDLAAYHASNDELVRFTMEVLWPSSLRGQTIADIGCGGGSLLDHLKGLPKTALAIEPDHAWALSLQERGYCWYHGTDEAAADHLGRVDMTLSIQVIEHVNDPRAFLAGIARLLKPDGLLVLSTPNRDDILMDLLPDDFPPFFYRSQHRWYFTAAALARCCEEAGFKIEEVRSVHRYSMANALLWLRDKRPQGRTAMAGIDRTADAMWKAQLEATGRGDCLYLIARLASPVYLPAIAQ